MARDMYKKAHDANAAKDCDVKFADLQNEIKAAAVANTKKAAAVAKTKNKT